MASQEEHEARDSDLTRRYESVRKELRRISDRVEYLEAELGRVRVEEERGRVRQSRLEESRRKLSYRLAVAEWRLESLRQRARWRVMEAISRDVRNPRRTLLLPRDVLRELRRKPPELAPPVPPSAVVESGSTPRGIDSPGTAEIPPPAMPPRRPIVCAAIVTDDVDLLLSYEFQVFRLDSGSWAEQLRELRPQIIVVEFPLVDGWTRHGVQAMLDVAEGLPSVLWITGEEDPEGLREAVSVVAIRDGLSSFTDSHEHRVGNIQPALHNPVLHERRGDGTTTLDDASPLFAGMSPLEAAQYPKRYSAVVAKEGFRSPHRERIMATSTPLVEWAEPLHRELTPASDLDVQRSAHRAMRMVMRESSVGTGVDEILQEVGLTGDSPLPPIGLMVATNRPGQITKLFENVARQTYPRLTLTLVAHGISVDKGQVEDLAQGAKLDHLDIVDAPAHLTSGEVFSRGFTAAPTELVAKMDDDDFYGPEYLWDLYTALSYSGADVVGKWAHFVYLGGRDALIYRFGASEHTFRPVVAISTLLLHRHVFEVADFPAMQQGSGSVFLRSLGERGGRVYAADRWNYLYMRTEAGEANTFEVSDDRLKQSAQVIRRGLDVEEVIA